MTFPPPLEHLSREELIALVEALQAELLSLSRSSLYYTPIAPSAEEIALKHRIDELYTQYPFYGSRKVAEVLRREGTLVNRNAVQRHMREMGIAAVGPEPNLSRRHQEHRVYPYLLRHRAITRPNEAWGIDLTYIRMDAGWVYLVAILDGFSRYVVAWEIDQTLELPFVLEAVERAFGQATPEILNSDQGYHFTSAAYLALVESRQVQVSMDGKKRALDNIFVERLWRSVKWEEVYLNAYESPRAARQGLGRYFRFYNTERPHQSLGYRTPAEIYFGEAAQAA